MTTTTDTPTHVHAPGQVLVLRAHRRLRGPYTAGGELLRHIVPALVESEAAAPDRALADLLARSTVAVEAIAPELRPALPSGPLTLTNLAQGEERTRYYSVSRTRDLAHAVSDLAVAWAVRVPSGRARLVVWDLDEADPTDVQLVATLARRGRGALDVTTHPDGPPEDAPHPADLARHHVDSDGTSTLPEAQTAYDHLTEAERGALHDERATRLTDVPGAADGALLHHLEHGSDPARAVPALLASLERGFAAGFYDAALDVGRRGRALTVPGSEDWVRFTQRAIGAATYLDRPEEAMAMIRQTRRVTTDTAAQMRCAYMTAMLYTRHLPPEQRDQDLALEWANTAIALADGHPEERRRGFFGAFMRNARALVELHRGDLARSLVLVEEAIGVADRSLEPEAHALHRTVLVNNRARLQLGLQDLPGALRSFSEVIERDPDYEEPYFDRAGVHRALGDIDAAMADLTTAISLAMAFPEAHYNRADILLELGEDDAALRELDRTLDIDPDHVDALTNRAALLLAVGDLAGAAADIGHGLEVDPQSAHLWSARGLVESEGGDDDAACVSFGRALHIDPACVQALANRAVVRYRQGRLEDSVRDLDTAIAAEDGGALRVNRGIGLHDLGHFDAAAEDFTVALTLPDADPAEALFRRGLSRAAAGDRAGADADWQAHLRACAEVGVASPHLDELAALRAREPERPPARQGAGL